MINKSGRSDGLRWLAVGLAAGWVGHRLLRARPRSMRGEVVLISGASRGLGLAMARQFSAAGCRLAICARDEAELVRARQDLQSRGASDVFALVCDVTNRQQVDQMVDRVLQQFGQIDVLVNNAGLIQVAPIEALGREDFEQAMAANYWAAFHLIWAVLPHMRGRKNGQIVNITSIGGKVAVPHLLPYDAAKAALISLSEGLTAELSKDGIAVTTIVPGLMRTGSPLNAQFKGNVSGEFQWFSIGDSLRLTSMSASRAASLIFDATRYKSGVVVLGWQAKALRLAHALFPNLLLRVNTVVNAALPRITEVHPSANTPGHDIARSGATAALTGTMTAAAADLNQNVSQSPSVDSAAAK